MSAGIARRSLLDTRKIHLQRNSPQELESFFSERKCQEAELATGEHQQRASREMSVFHPFDDANDYHMRA